MNRPLTLYKSLIKPDKDIAKQLEDKTSKIQSSLASDIFKKSYDEISSNDLHRFVEELISSLYVLRKNLPFNFNQIFRLVMNHPNIRPIDRNVS